MNADSIGMPCPNSRERRWGSRPASALFAVALLLAAAPETRAQRIDGPVAVYSNPFLLDTTADSDGDGLSDGAERNVHGTRPDLADSDGDGVNDGDELARGTDPLNSDADDGRLVQVQVYSNGFLLDTTLDSDGDGLTDGAERNVYGTRPDLADSDGDGVNDGDELAQGTDPLLPNTPPDDGEVVLVQVYSNGFLLDTTLDSDGDGLTDGAESNVYGTNPDIADTDGDGISDGREVAQGSNPLVGESEGPVRLAINRSQGRLILLVTAPVGVSVDVDRSFDFEEWETVDSFTGEGEESPIAVPIDIQAFDFQFFRAR